MSATLLVEIGVEELPPKALRGLLDAFADGIVAGLDEAGLAHGVVTRYATPRRLAVAVADTAAVTAAQQIEKSGPTVAIAFDAEGNPTAAAEGFARSVGVSVAELERTDSARGERLVYHGEEPGAELAAIVPAIVADSLRRLPIPRRMRWGDSDDAFVRPVHWLVAMHGTQVLPLEAFGLVAGRITHGHRFLHAQPIELTSASDYCEQLRQPGHVIADPDERRRRVHEQVVACADALDAAALIDPALLDEVTALVEWPVALSGRFDTHYLQLPREVLISTLQSHQRYFPVQDGGELCNAFITVANIDSSDPAQVIAGNERVVRPRLADALFFWQQDRRTGLAAYADRLDQVSYQQDLGTMADKTARIQALALWLARAVEHDDTQSLLQAAALAKADLLTDMVDEFPDLQGTMGHYYARAAGLDASVAQAIGEHYAPVGAGAPIAASAAGRLLSLADHLDTLAGIFALGQRPSGDKDPFALRRAALGVLRTLIEAGLTIDLRAALDKALQQQPMHARAGTADELVEFHFDRLHGYYLEQGFTAEQFAAVAATRTTDMVDFDHRIRAVAEFMGLAAAAIVCGAHKRARNILKKNGSDDIDPFDAQLLADPHEQGLADALTQQRQTFDHALAGRAYPTALASLADLAQPLDAFFEHVMVMTEDDALRRNRLALLTTLDERCRRVADLSRLSV